MRHPKGNVIITQSGYVISSGNIHYIPECICAFLDGNDPFMCFAVVHDYDNDKTKIMRSIGNGDDYLVRKNIDNYHVLITINELVDIINIIKYRSTEAPIYIFFTPEGPKYAFNTNGKKVKIPDEIPKDTIDIVGRYYVNYDGEVTDVHSELDVIDRIKGYDLSRRIAWSDHQIFDMTSPEKDDVIRFNYRRDIEDVHWTNGDNGIIYLFILSGRHIHVKTILPDGTIENQVLRGEWSSAPMYLRIRLYAIDSGGVLRDIRVTSDDKHKNDIIGRSILHPLDTSSADGSDMLYSIDESVFEKGGRTGMKNIGELHGMRVFTRRYIKSALSGLDQ